MNKSSIINLTHTAIISSFIAILPTKSFAVMAPDTNLNFIPLEYACNAAGPNPGTPPNNCNYGSTIVGGSYFGFDTDSDDQVDESEFISIQAGSVGLNVNQTQGVHGDIDSTWVFFGGPGNHTTVSDVNVLSDDGVGNVTLDFSGWNMAWTGIPFINLGGGIQNCGTNIDGVCVGVDTSGNSFDVDGLVNNGTSIATVTCANTCEQGDDYSLVYTATVPWGDPSGFGGAFYCLELHSSTTSYNSLTCEAATVGEVPIPASIWLFLSGLIGLGFIPKNKKPQNFFKT